MSKYRLTVLKGVSAQQSVTAAAAQSGISRGHLHRLAAVSSPSSTSGRLRSSPSTRVNSSRAISSSPTRATGATKERTPADGRGPWRSADRRCNRCRDSCVTDVATQDSGAPGGIRTPDHLIRSPLPVGAAARADSCVERPSRRRRSRRFRGESGSRPGDSLRPRRVNSKESDALCWIGLFQMPATTLRIIHFGIIRLGIRSPVPVE